MLEPLPDLPDGVLGFEAVGEVRADDYEQVLRPAIEAATEHGIRLVYVLGDRFEAYSARAMWEDTKLGAGHLRGWERTALVSDHDWVRHLSSGFGWMMPGRFRAFSLAELPAAIEWVAARDE